MTHRCQGKAKLSSQTSGHPRIHQQEAAKGAPKARVTIRLDRSVLTFFKSGKEPYQAWINAVLREHVEAQLKRRDEIDT